VLDAEESPLELVVLEVDDASLDGAVDPGGVVAELPPFESVL
jgi:hypothetical protein